MCGFNHSNYVVKREFFKKRAVVATCYCSIQSFFKIEFDITTLFNVYFLYGKSRTVWVTDRELPIAGKE